jgi:hypothetical protein
MAIAAVAALGSAVSGQDESDVRKRDAINKLNGMKISVDFSGVPMSAALEYVREVSGLNLHIDGKCAEKADEAITLKVKDLSLKSVLKLMLAPKELTAVWRDGVLVIAPKGAAVSAVLRVYDVRDLMAKIGDFPGPKVELVAPGSGPMVGIVVTDLSDPKPIIEPEFLTELVKGNTGGTSWEDPACSLSMANGLLVVSQSKGVQAEVEDFLNKLRAFK